MMLHFRCNSALVALALWVGACPADGGERGKDADGDALPAGVIARLGSKRWRTSAIPGRISLAPDRKSLVVATGFNTIEFIGLSDGKRQLTLGSPNNLFGLDLSGSAAVSPDRRQFAFLESVGLRPVIRVRDLTGRSSDVDFAFGKPADYKPPLPPEAENARTRTSTSCEYVTRLMFSPDGRMLAADVKYQFKCWGEDEKHLFVDLEETTVRLWEIASAKEVVCAGTDLKEITGFLFSADRKTLIGASADGSVYYWDTATGGEKGRWRNGRPAPCSAFAEDGKWLALGGRGGITVCDAETGKVRVRATLPPADLVPALACVAFSPDGKRLFGGFASSMAVWDAASGAMLSARNLVPAPVKSVAFSPDGSVLFSVHEREQLVRRWDATSLRPLPESAGHAGLVRGLGFTPDGTRLLTVVLGNDGRAWPARGGEPIPGGKEDRERLAIDWLRSSGQTSLLLCEDVVLAKLGVMTGAIARLEQVGPCFGMSIGGDRVAALTANGKEATLEVRDGSSGRLLRAISPEDPSHAVGALSPNGHTLAAAVDGGLRFIDVDSGTERRYPLAAAGKQPDHVASIKFAPDGKRLAIIGENGLVRVLTAADGRLVREIRAPKAGAATAAPDSPGDPVAGCAFSPDGKTLFTCRNLFAALDGSPAGASAWEIATGQRIRTYGANSLLVSPDNRLVASSEEDCLHLYELYSGKTFCDRKGSLALTGNLAFSPDGRLLAASAADTTVLVWDTTTGAAAAVGRKLDAENLEQLWRDLREGDAPQAYAAIGRLIADPDSAVPYLVRRLRTVPVADADRLARLIAQLDDDNFQTRVAAHQRLAELGELAEPALRAALLKETTSAERRRRLTELVNAIGEVRRVLSPDELAHVRGIQVLERVHAPEAERLLQALASGADSAERTRDARDALARLRSRAGK
jgi:WD40 repeat protein